VTQFLRFPNPGSDFHKFVGAFQVIARALKSEPNFDLDDAARVLVHAGQASSSGAIGAEALRRSTRQDRSRDPLYNQLKMYTEIYRMLGWVHPVDRKLSFRITPLGAHVEATYGSGDPHIAALIQQCLVSIAFPNPNTIGRGVANVRPFLTMLRFFDALDGYASRDELIVGVYTLSDDTNTRDFERSVSRIRALRKSGPDALRASLARAAGAVQVNTLKNYTRFPLGALKSELISWAQPESTDSKFDERVLIYRLTESGRRFARAHANLRDIRSEELTSANLSEKAHFLALAHYMMYERTGLGLASAGIDIGPLADGCARLLENLGIADPRDILFSPFQQADHTDIARAMSLT
jgi:hypothetical protein